jgi:hypothetical protein
MTSQLISLLIIIAVLVIDFIINGRKKNVDDTQKRIEGYEGLKKFNLFEYLLLRKKNLVVFILFVFLSKPILHTSFFPDTKEAVNFNKEVLIRNFTNCYYQNSEDELINFSSGDIDLITPNEYDKLVAGMAFTKNGENIILKRGESSSNFIYYPLETMPLSFNEHLELMFKSKLWIFLVSIGALTVIVFLFNDKIKAR